MNTNIKITLTDEQRNHIKNLIDGKTSAKLVSRAEVSNLVQMFVDNLIESKQPNTEAVVQESIGNLSGYKFYAPSSSSGSSSDVQGPSEPEGGYAGWRLNIHWGSLLVFIPGINGCDIRSVICLLSGSR